MLLDDCLFHYATVYTTLGKAKYAYSSILYIIYGSRRKGISQNSLLQEVTTGMGEKRINTQNGKTGKTAEKKN